MAVKVGKKYPATIFQCVATFSRVSQQGRLIPGRWRLLPPLPANGPRSIQQQVLATSKLK